MAALLYSVGRIAATTEYVYERTLCNDVATSLCNTAAFGSNVAAFGSNVAAYGCNLATYASNAIGSVTRASDTAQLGIASAAWASNTAVFGSNLVTGMSQLSQLLVTTGAAAAYGSNAAVFAFDTAAITGTAAAFASNTAVAAASVAAAADSAAVYASNATVRGLAAALSVGVAGWVGVGTSNPGYGLDVAQTVRMSGKPGAGRLTLPTNVTNATFAASFFGGNNGVLYGTVTLSGGGGMTLAPGGGLTVSVPLGFASSNHYILTATSVAGTLPCHVTDKSSNAFTLQLFNPYSSTQPVAGSAVDFQILSPI